MLSNEYPSAGFTIYTGGKPFFEVIVAAEPRLFDPANELKRNARNYYAGRGEHGLLPTSGGEAVYLLPTPALNALLSGSPRPRLLYYLVVAYQDAQGTNPQPSHRTFTDGALPSFQIRSDFETHSLAAAMGIGFERLVLSQSVPYMAPTGAFSMWNSTALADDDSEGEDGYSLNRLHTTQSFSTPSASFDAGEYWNGIETEEAAPQGTTYSRQTAANGFQPPYRNGQTRAAYPAAYSDGFGVLDDEPAEETESVSHSNSYADPVPLLADDPDYDGRDDQRHDIGEPVALSAGSAPRGGRAGQGYGDEADGFSFSSVGRGLQEIPAPAAPPPASTAPQPLTVADKMQIIQRVARSESASSGGFAAVNRDTEFTSLTHHPAYQHYHVGLSFGLVQFTQDSGSLGQLLQLMREKDQAAFDRIFALPDHPTAPADLIDLTTRPGVPSRDAQGGRSARVQPLHGHDLWEEPWVSRFIQAGAHPPFQAAQYQLAAHLYIDPMLRLAGWFGLDTDRALTLVVDRSINMGVGGANAFLANAVGPLKTEPMRQQALAALGHTNLQAFQTATPGLTRDGAFGPMTHAAMTFALRRLPHSPVPLPPLSQMLDDIVRAAGGTAFARRVTQLRQATDYSDTAFALL